MKLRVTFLDSHGAQIETFEAKLGEAQKRVARFMKLHGLDPEADGKNAMAGTIKFEPVASSNPREEKTCKGLPSTKP